MDHWLCTCGKKVVLRLTVCPYCKKPLEKTPVNSAGGGANKKVIISGLLAIIICLGGYLILKKDTVKIVEQPKPIYVVQPQAQPPHDLSNPTQQPQPTAGATPTSSPIDPINQSQPKKTVPQVAIDAVNALKKLQAKTQAGIIHKDYSPALGDAKYAINLFTESQTSKEFPELIKSIDEAYSIFKTAGEVWALKFSGSGITEFLPKEHYMLQYVFIRFPEAKKDIRQGGTIVNNESFSIDYGISFLFSEANKETQKASSMIER